MGTAIGRELIADDQSALFLSVAKLLGKKVTNTAVKQLIAALGMFAAQRSASGCRAVAEIIIQMFLPDAAE